MHRSWQPCKNCPNRNRSRIKIMTNNRNNKHDTNDRILILSIIIFLGTLLAREFVVSFINGPLVVGLMAALMLLLPYKQCVSFVFFVLPLTCGIPGYSMLVAYIILILKSKIINIWQIIPPICIVLLEFWHVCRYDFESSLVAVFSFSSFILVFFYLIFNRDNRVSNIDCIKLYVIGAIIASLIVILKLGSSHGFEELLLGSLRGGVRSNAEQQLIGQFDLNANSMAFYSITAFSCLLIGRKAYSMKQVNYLLCMIASILVGIISFSRTWILVAILAILLYIIIKHKNIKTIVFSLLFAGLVVYAVPIFFDNLMEVFIGRFTLDNMETGGGRAVIFDVYHNAFINNPKFYIGGTGVVHYTEVVGYPLAMHSGFQQLYVCCGMIGVFVFAVSALYYKKRYVTRKIPLLFYIPLISCLIFDQSIQFLNPYYLMFPFIPAVYILQLKST